MNNTPFKQRNLVRKEEPENKPEAGSKYPDLNTLVEGVQFNHSTPVFGESIGFTEKEVFEMSLKFEEASRIAKAESSGGYVSRVVQLVVPKLTSKELIFCVGMVVQEKVKFERQGTPKVDDLKDLLDALKRLKRD